MFNCYCNWWRCIVLIFSSKGVGAEDARSCTILVFSLGDISCPHRMMQLLFYLVLIDFHREIIGRGSSLFSYLFWGRVARSFVVCGSLQKYFFLLSSCCYFWELKLCGLYRRCIFQCLIGNYGGFILKIRLHRSGLFPICKT